MCVCVCERVHDVSCYNHVSCGCGYYVNMIVTESSNVRPDRSCAFWRKWLKMPPYISVGRLFRHGSSGSNDKAHHFVNDVGRSTNHHPRKRLSRGYQKKRNSVTMCNSPIGTRHLIPIYHERDSTNLAHISMLAWPNHILCSCFACKRFVAHMRLFVPWQNNNDNCLPADHERHSCFIGCFRSWKFRPNTMFCMCRLFVRS